MNQFKTSLRYRRQGLTLVELLIVVAIMGILLGLLSGAIKHTVTNARKKKIEAERATLSAAIINFWHDYGRWPHEEGQEQTKIDRTDQHDVPVRRRYYGHNNWRVFNRLVSKNLRDNPLGKAYLDESGFTTTEGNDAEGRRVGLTLKRRGAFSPSDRSSIVHHDGKPYWITFDLVQDTVTISLEDPR